VSESEELSQAEISVFRELAAKAQIHDALMRYCRGVDRGDPDLICSAYHPDAIEEHPLFSATGSTIGPIIVERLAGKSTWSMHTICNELIEVRGDVAYSESYNITLRDVVGEGEPDDPAMWAMVHAGVRYIDRFERRDGEWRIAHRACIQEFSRTDLAPRTERVGPFRSSRSRDDFSYSRVPPTEPPSTR
jgi:hypothetical protein